MAWPPSYRDEILAAIAQRLSGSLLAGLSRPPVANTSCGRPAKAAQPTMFSCEINAGESRIPGLLVPTLTG